MKKYWRRFLFLASVALLGCVCAGGPPRGDDIKAGAFLSPPAWARPQVMWHWVGYNVTKEGITKDLESMKNAGIAGALIFQITSAGTSRFTSLANVYTPGIEYYNDKWFALLRHAAAEADRLGLELGLHNCIGWSVSGGSWITPENTMMQVVWSEAGITGPIAYDKFLAQPASKLNYYKDIAVLLVPRSGEPSPGKIIDVTDKMRPDGRLICEIPKGKYTIYRFGHTPTGSKPSAAPKNTNALEADKMSAHAMRLHMKNVLKPLKKNLGDYFGRSFKIINFDSYEAGAQNWTPLMRTEFQARKGYDIIPWLPVLAGRIIESKEASEGFQRDLKTVIADMYLEYSFRLPKKMINEMGLEMQSEPYMTGPGHHPKPFNTFDAAPVVDRPTTEFWFHRRRDELDIWQVNAALPFFGKTVLSAEAFSGRGEHSSWNETPARLKFSGDIAFSRGVNRMILHHWVHQPFPDHLKPGMCMGPWGTHFGRNQTWYEPGKAWLSYLARSQYLLQQGEKVSDFVSLDVYMPGGDVISRKTLLNHVTIKDGNVVSPTGRTYKLLAVPNQGTLELETLEKIGEVVEQGAVIFGPKPTTPAPCRDFPAAAKRFKKLADRLWGEGTPSSKGENICGSGKVLWGGSVEEALRGLGVSPSVKFNGAVDDSICWQHRKAGDTDIFYFSNIEAKPKLLNLVLRSENKTPEIWNPETGSVSPLAVWHPTDAGVGVSLPLKANEALFVVFRKPVARKDFAANVISPESGVSYAMEARADAGWIVKAPEAGDYILQTAAGKTLRATVASAPESMAISGEWKVKFEPPAGGSFSSKLTTLESWTCSGDKRIKYFSGTAIYTNTFTIPKGNIANDLSVLLKLGDVREMASVSINGRQVGTLWHAPFEIDVTQYIKPGVNEISISVTNTWANRLIGDGQYPDDCEWGWGNAKEGRPLRMFPAWLIEGKPRPSAQRQAFSTWNYFTEKSALLDAGLLGEVKLEFWRHAAFQ
ncbi:glycosyl hydrolase [Ereboglobus luteus]|uniref:Beta-mannosidase-like galactose-binding domain-containing protein n=1 Tax=Ereboglobus luteus TaxID=1796921 RepID=A0A2U8E0H1_9BACT|nr:glycosyl hydrolase [Ereboglobus luteus]AWI08357.1 hypothetical protein CKA38_02975 [Ereboglobus luteus]